MAAVLRAPVQTPAQPELLGLEPPAAASAAPEIKWSMVGRLLRQAEVRISPGGQHGHLIVQVMQPPHGTRRRMPVVAVVHAHADQVPALQALATRLTAGSLVLCLCRGIDTEHEPALTNDGPRLRAWRCDRIAPIDAASEVMWLADAAIDGAGAGSPTTNQ